MMNKIFVNQISNNNIMINIYDCFYFTFCENIKIFESYCDCCRLFTKKMNNNLIKYLPNILTMILSNNENCNIILNSVLDLKNYANTSLNDGKYYLISILCKIIYNEKFIIYSINPYNGIWYSYEDQTIKQVKKMDINAVPLALFYQAQNTMSYLYNEIEIDQNKVLLIIKFNNQMTPITIYFNRNDTYKNVIHQISLVKKIEESKIKLLVDGKLYKEDQILSNIVKNNSTYLVIVNE